MQTAFNTGPVPEQHLQVLHGPQREEDGVFRMRGRGVGMGNADRDILGEGLTAAEAQAAFYRDVSSFLAEAVAQRITEALQQHAATMQDQQAFIEELVQQLNQAEAAGAPPPAQPPPAVPPHPGPPPPPARQPSWFQRSMQSVLTGVGMYAAFKGVVAVLKKAMAGEAKWQWLNDVGQWMNNVKDGIQARIDQSQFCQGLKPKIEAAAEYLKTHGSGIFICLSLAIVGGVAGGCLASNEGEAVAFGALGGAAGAAIGAGICAAAGIACPPLGVVLICGALVGALAGGITFSCIP